MKRAVSWVWILMAVVSVAAAGEERLERALCDPEEPRNRCPGEDCLSTELYASEEFTHYRHGDSDSVSPKGNLTCLHMDASPTVDQVTGASGVQQIAPHGFRPICVRTDRILASRTASRAVRAHPGSSPSSPSVPVPAPIGNGYGNGNVYGRR